MDKARYILAVIVLVSLPPGIVFWYLVHPFARHWRKVGPAVTYTTVSLLMILLGFGIYQLREPLLRVDFGFNRWLAWLALAVYLVAVVIEIQCRRHLKLRVLVGLPELAPGQSPGVLLTEGIYGRVRHPRYLGIAIALLAIALFTNYLATYLLFGVCLVLIWGLMLIEESELRQRFGEQYERYSRDVPRFIPRSTTPSPR
jgi:protein-S-isoprenylcysteine O-methyltransferase Ste14